MLEEQNVTDHDEELGTVFNKFTLSLKHFRSNFLYKITTYSQPTKCLISTISLNKISKDSKKYVFNLSRPFKKSGCG